VGRTTTQRKERQERPHHAAQGALGRREGWTSGGEPGRRRGSSRARRQCRADGMDGAEVRAFLDVAAGDRLSAIWRLALTTGLRRGGLLGLEWDEVDQASVYVRPQVLLRLRAVQARAGCSSGPHSRTDAPGASLVRRTRALERCSAGRREPDAWPLIQRVHGGPVQPLRRRGGSGGGSDRCDATQIAPGKYWRNARGPGSPAPCLC
jgi:hypothetical protein